MSELFAGLTRRINEFVHDLETSEELSHLVDEARVPGGDAADALIELALGEEHIDDDDDIDGESIELDAIVEDDDDDDGGSAAGDDGDIDASAAESDLEALAAELGDADDADDDLLESAQLRPGEVLVL